eukprot:tig00001001_g6210.t1
MFRPGPSGPCRSLDPRAFAPHADPALGGGSFATRDIAPGEIVQRNEEKQLIPGSAAEPRSSFRLRPAAAAAIATHMLKLAR